MVVASAHFVVGKDGEVAQLVPLTKQAWHAGRGGPLMRIPKNQGNTYCVGIESIRGCGPGLERVAARLRGEEPARR